MLKPLDTIRKITPNGKSDKFNFRNIVVGGRTAHWLPLRHDKQHASVHVEEWVHGRIPHAQQNQRYVLGL